MSKSEDKTHLSCEVALDDGRRAKVDLLGQSGGSTVVLGPAGPAPQDSSVALSVTLRLLGDAICRLAIEGDRAASDDGKALLLEKTLDEFGAGFIFLDQSGRILASSRWLQSVAPKGKTLYGIVEPKVLAGLAFDRVTRTTVPLLLGETRENCDVCFIPFSIEGSKVRWVAIVKGRSASEADSAFASGERDHLEPVMVGRTEPVQRMRTALEKAASTGSTVLLTGQTGTGKSLAARWIHAHSPRRAGPFVAVNCSALPPTLIESELFGYDEGAFTGAKRGGKPGKFELAENGTILLDEVGDLPLDMQGKILQVLDLGEVDRIGGRAPRKVNARIIAATNKDLSKMVGQGTFRADLYYRLSVIAIGIPALSERREDIPDLVSHFIERLSIRTGKGRLAVSDEALRLLMQYAWPGNVRELANAVEYAMVFCDSGTIQPQHLPPRIFADYSQDKKPAYSLEEAERREVAKCVDAYGLSEKGKREIAKTLGISRSTLYRKLRKYGFLSQPRDGQSQD